MNNENCAVSNKNLNSNTPVTPEIRKQFERQDRPAYWKDRINQIDGGGIN